MFQQRAHKGRLLHFNGTCFSSGGSFSTTIKHSSIQWIYLQNKFAVSLYFSWGKWRSRHSTYCLLIGASLFVYITTHVSNKKLNKICERCKMCTRITCFLTFSSLFIHLFTSVELSNGYWSGNLTKYSYFLDSERLRLREEARRMFYFGYDNYMKFAFPKDELDPIHCTGRGPDYDNP